MEESLAAFREKPASYGDEAALSNAKRRAVHDFLADTVCIRV